MKVCCSVSRYVKVFHVVFFLQVSLPNPDKRSWSKVLWRTLAEFVVWVEGKVKTDAWRRPVDYWRTHAEFSDRFREPYCERSCVEIWRGFSVLTYKMHFVKYNKVQIVKQNSCHAPAPTCFGTVVPTEGSLITKKGLNSNTCFRCY
jgi:hypothetical protein